MEPTFGTRGQGYAKHQTLTDVHGSPSKSTRECHVETLVIYKLGFDQNYYKFA